MSTSETGLTALEVVVAMALLLTVSVLGFSAVGTVFGLTSHTLDSAQSATVSDLAIHDLSQEAMSANIVFDPTTEGSNPGLNPDGTSIPAGFSLRIYTQNNGLFSCVQWRLLDTGSLQVRQWPDGSTPGSWSTLLARVVNYAPPAPFSTLTKPFVLDAASSYYGGSNSGGKLLDVDLILDEHNSETPIEVKTSIAGRDAWYYPPDTGFCHIG